MSTNNSKYMRLDFTHEEVNHLLSKIQNGMVLSEKEYNQLFKEIELENISTFSGDFEDLLNKPEIPTALGELVNDIDLQDSDDVFLKLEQFKKDVVEKLLEKKADNEQLEILQDEIENANIAMNNKANKDELFNKDYNELINKPEIPSIEGLATEMYVDEKILDLIDFAPEAMNTIRELADMINEHGNVVDGLFEQQKELLDKKVDKKDGYALMNEIEMRRLAIVENYDDSEVRALLDEKANKNELPSIEGLASEQFVQEQIAAIKMPEIPEMPNLDPFVLKEEMNLALKNKVDKKDGFDLMDVNEMARLAEVDNYDDAELRDMIKAAEEFAKEQDNALKEEIENSLAEEMNKINANMEEIGAANEEALEANKAMEEQVKKLEAKNEELNKAMEDLKVKVDEEEPYLADVPAYPTSKFLFACGQPMTVDVNENKKYDPNAADNAVVFIYRWDDGFKCISLDPETAAKTYLVGGYGHDNVNAKRPIPQTNMLVKNVKIKGLVGGSYFEGMVGHVNMEAINCEFTNVIGGGWCGAAVNGKTTRMNIADDVHIKLDNCKVSSTLFGGPQGNGVADDVHMELNNCEIGWLTAGGSNGMTRNAVVVMNDGKVKVAQSTNRGVVHKARFIMNDGLVEKLYFGGETEDASVNGLIEDGFLELNGGTVNKFNFGTNNGKEMIAEEIKGTIMNCIVTNGDVSMLEKVNVSEEFENYDDSELRAMIDEQKPFLADLAAYPTSKFLFACGQPMTVEPNTNHKYDANMPEDAVAFVYRWDDGFECIMVEKEVAAKVYLVGGYGHENIHVKRPIPQTNMLVRDVKLKGLVGGSYFEGMVGHVTMEAENCEITNIIGGGWCGAAVNGEMTRMNIADDINIKLNNVKGLSLVFGGPQGNGVANKVHMELNNCEAGWVTAGGSNGMTRDAVVIINGGSVKVAQSTNRGIVNKARFVVIDGVVEKLYFGGETEDSSVTGIIEDNFVELIGGEVKDFCFGTNNGIEMSAEDMKGTVTNCAVAGESVAVLEKIDTPMNPNVGDCVFNEKLNKPIWFNGKNWIDAYGCIVG